ncbi:hypothetical protein N2152v2_006152 [Parachlorella kessleri]
MPELGKEEQPAEPQNLEEREEDADLEQGPALLETLHRADSKLQTTFRQAKEPDSVVQSFFDEVAANIANGVSALSSTVAKGAEELGNSISDSFGNKAGDVASFFKSLSINSSSAAPTPARSVAGGSSQASVATSGRSSFTTTRESSEPGPGTAKDTKEGSFTVKEVEGIYGVDYSKYPIASYVKLPSALQPFVNLPGLDHYMVVARPTMDKSGGLAGYREVVPKTVRAAAPFLIVVDEPGTTVQDKGYLWYEFKLVDVFKLDVSKMKSFDDYLAKLSKKGRWNCKDRQKKLNASPLKVEYIPLTQDRAFLETLWPLYQRTGEKNGFCVLGEKEFFDFHLNTPDLTVMMIKDTSKDNQIVTFCTGVRAGDTLMPMWCGTDYDHELAMKCSTYYNMLYEYFKIAIADPAINWVDLGATRRTAKTSIGCEGYPVSGYVRCKNSIMLAIVDTMMKEYFNPSEFMQDP